MHHHEDCGRRWGGTGLLLRWAHSPRLLALALAEGFNPLSWLQVAGDFGHFLVVLIILVALTAMTYCITFGYMKVRLRAHTLACFHSEIDTSLGEAGDVGGGNKQGTLAERAYG